MKEKQDAEQENKTEKLIGLVLFPIGTAFSMAMASGVACAMFGDWIEDIFGISPAWWQGALAGLLVGLVLGFIQAFVGLKRSKEIAEASSSLGLKRLASDDVGEVSSKLRKMVSERVSLSDCYFNSIDGAHLVVGQLTIVGTESHGSDGASSSSPDQIQSCVYFKFDNFVFPQFELKPEGFMLRMLNAVMGADINFDDSPVFSKKYSLAGNSETQIRQLFDKNTREFFEQNQGLKVIADNNQLLVFRPRKICKASELELLVEKAMEVASVIQTSGENIAPTSIEKPTSQPISKAAALERAAQAPGIFSSLLKHRIETTTVDQKEMTRFLDQPTPRQIPGPLKKRFRIDPFLLVFSCFFMLGGAGFLLVGILAQFDMRDRAIIILLALLLGSVGAVIFFLCRHFNKRKKNVLTRGTVVHGIVESVRETSLVLGNQRVYEAKLIPLVNGQATTDEGSAIITRFHGCNIQRAMDRAESKEPMIVLQDPQNPRNTLLIECFML